MDRISEIYMCLLYDIKDIYSKETSKDILQNNIIYKLIILSKFFISSKGFRAIAVYRLSRYMYLGNHKLLFYIMNIVNILVNDVEINYCAKIGPGLIIPHAQCIVIGPAIIGKNVGISQGVTIGASFDKEKGGRKCAIIGNNVWIGAGAKILGPISIGNNSIIGANSVVVKDIPANSIAVGIPAKVIKSSDSTQYHTKVFNRD